MTPLAAPRAAVGNSSGPYTPRAGTAMAPNTDPRSENIQIDQPPTRYIPTVKTTPAPTPTAPISRRPRRSASLPPITIPSPPGVFVRIWKTVIVPAEKPRSVRRYSLRNDDAGSTNSDRDSPDADSSSSRPRSMPAGIRSRRCRCPAGARLRSSEAVNRRVSGICRPMRTHHRHRGEGHEEQDPPGRRAEARHGHEHHREPGAERAGGAQHRHREGPRPGRHLLDGDDADDQHERGRERPGHGLADAEGGQVRGQRAGGRDQAAGDGRPQQHPAPSPPVGRGRDHGGQQRAHSHGGQHHADLAVGDAELLLEEGVRLGRAGCRGSRPARRTRTAATRWLRRRR